MRSYASAAAARALSSDSDTSVSSLSSASSRESSISPADAFRSPPDLKKQWQACADSWNAASKLATLARVDIAGLVDQGSPGDLRNASVFSASAPHSGVLKPSPVSTSAAWRSGYRSGSSAAAAGSSLVDLYRSPLGGGENVASRSAVASTPLNLLHSSPSPPAASASSAAKPSSQMHAVDLSTVDPEASLLDVYYQRARPPPAFSRGVSPLSTSQTFAGGCSQQQQQPLMIASTACPSSPSRTRPRTSSLATTVPFFSEVAESAPTAAETLRRSSDVQAMPSSEQGSVLGNLSAITAGGSFADLNRDAMRGFGASRFPRRSSVGESSGAGRLVPPASTPSQAQRPRSHSPHGLRSSFDGGAAAAAASLGSSGASSAALPQGCGVSFLSRSGAGPPGAAHGIARETGAVVKRLLREVMAAVGLDRREADSLAARMDGECLTDLAQLKALDDHSWLRLGLPLGVEQELRRVLGVQQQAQEQGGYRACPLPPGAMLRRQQMCQDILQSEATAESVQRVLDGVVKRRSQGLPGSHGGAALQARRPRGSGAHQRPGGRSYSCGRSSHHASAATLRRGRFCG
eukprot:TRINITY_DN24806_c0_g1_i1.p1 TRINITY_DN24806_c0_g1~~TRINITY_DN24806_c0_g1_i1.p1  ORF type:complete len:577 (-),score=101.95 TRINITY_DN24806_c0_g1_i1:29-1759(-)